MGVVKTEAIAEREESVEQEKKRKDFFAGYWKQYIEKKLREFTLNDFEKEKYLLYIKNLVKYRAISLGGSNGCIIIKSLEKFFNADVSEILPEGEYELEDDFIYQEICQKLETILSKIKLPSYKDILKDKFWWLCNIFDLSVGEKEYLAFVYFSNNNECIKEVLDIYSGNRATYLFNNLFGYIYGEGEPIETSLLKKGILIKTSNSTVAINPYYERLLKDKTLTTKLKFEKYLIGKVQKTDLTVKDFDYIKQFPLMVSILKNASEQKKKGVNILLAGVCGSGKSSLAVLCAKEAGLNIYAVATDREEKEITRAERLADLNTKQAILSRMDNACLLFDEAEDAFNRGFGEEGTSSKGYLNRLLENNNVPCVWTTNDVWDVDPAFLRRFNYILSTPALDNEKRYNLWSRIVKKNKLKVSKGKLKELSETYDVQPSIIANAVETTKLVQGDENTFNDVVESVATIVAKKNEIKVENTFDMNDYNLDLINTDISIEKLFNQIKECGKLNFSMCFYGMPGTSKSSVAVYLSKLLGLDIVRKSCGDLLNAYVGETEHLIQAAFNEAKEKKAILIIDEADTFLRNRALANRSWEASMTNQFLQEMEHFEYPFIASTNLMDSLDDGILRRFVFKIEFKPLTKEQVKIAFKHFFKLESDFYMNGLTSGDFAVVRRKCSFLGIKDAKEICEMLTAEVKLKKDNSLQKSIGF